MGQYYRFVNIDKWEYISPRDFDIGTRLMEWSYKNNEFVKAMCSLMQNQWKGDRVYIVGDYASSQGYKDTCYTSLLVNIEKELGFYDKCSVNGDGHRSEYLTTLYEFADNNFVNISNEVETSRTARYVYNHSQKVYLDLCHANIAWIHGSAYKNKDECREIKVSAVQYSPLPLLLAMGNGLGGGDYTGEFDQDLVGSWCKDVTQLELTTSKLSNCKHYKEFKPNFSEHDVIDYTQIDDLCNLSQAFLTLHPETDYIYIKSPKDCEEYYNEIKGVEKKMQTLFDSLDTQLSFMENTLEVDASIKQDQLNDIGFGKDILS